MADDERYVTAWGKAGVVRQRLVGGEWLPYEPRAWGVPPHEKRLRRQRPYVLAESYFARVAPRKPRWWDLT